MVLIHLFIHPFVVDALRKCEVHAPARDLVLYCALACLARACATGSICVPASPTRFLRAFCNC